MFVLVLIILQLINMMQKGIETLVDLYSKLFFDLIVDILIKLTKANFEVLVATY